MSKKDGLNPKKTYRIYVYTGSASFIKLGNIKGANVHVHDTLTSAVETLKKVRGVKNFSGRQLVIIQYTNNYDSKIVHIDNGINI